MFRKERKMGMKKLLRFCGLDVKPCLDGLENIPYLFHQMTGV
jgi:hypothetical protein